MDHVTEDTAERLITVLEKVAHQRGDVERFMEQMLKNGSSHAQNMHFNTGGIGIWISALCCAFTTILMIAGISVGTITYMHLSDKIDKQQDYLNAIYAVAPQLKPKDETK